MSDASLLVGAVLTLVGTIGRYDNLVFAGLSMLGMGGMASVRRGK